MTPAEAERLPQYGRAEDGETLSRIGDHLLEALDQRDAAARGGTEMSPYGISATADGELICAATSPVVYYEVTEFSIAAPGGEWRSGDCFHACSPCRGFIDSSDWKGRLGSARRSPGSGTA